MKTSDNGRKFIEQFEGLVLHAADDGFGTLTVGYGHTSTAGKPEVTSDMVFTKADADTVLSWDLGKVEDNVNKLVKVPLTQSQFDALVSFDFNTGGLRRASLLTKLNNKDYKGAADGLLAWDHANGKQVKGLTRRRQAERTMFLSDIDKELKTNWFTDLWNLLFKPKTQPITKGNTNMNPTVITLIEALLNAFVVVAKDTGKPWTQVLEDVINTITPGKPSAPSLA